MAESGFFRTSFRGFDKMDVLQYIDELQQRQKTELEDLQQRLAEAEEQAAQARNEAAGQEERLREAEGS